MCNFIVYIPVKNDLWCIENAIRHAVAWADHVIVADESSTDGSVDIYKKLEEEYSNLRIIYDRPKMDFTTPDMRNYMLEHVRKVEGCNIISELHADEIISAKVLKQETKNEIIQELPIGKCLELPWLALWKNPFQYRDDNSVWSNNSCIFAFRDDRTSIFKSPAYHGPRVPDSYLKNKVVLKHIPVIHYQFINIGMNSSKQALHHIFERNHYPDKNVASTNKLLAACFDERKLQCRRLEEEDYVPWLDLGLKIDQICDEEAFNWRDAEVLKNFYKYGLERYAKMNIWHIDWEKKRQYALKMGLANVPSPEITDPRTLNTKLAHKFLNRYQRYPFWTIDFLRLLLSRAAIKVKRKISNNNDN